MPLFACSFASSIRRAKERREPICVCVCVCVRVCVFVCMFVFVQVNNQSIYTSLHYLCMRVAILARLRFLNLHVLMNRLSIARSLMMARRLFTCLSSSLVASSFALCVCICARVCACVWAGEWEVGGRMNDILCVCARARVCVCACVCMQTFRILLALHEASWRTWPSPLRLATACG